MKSPKSLQKLTSFIRCSFPRAIALVCILSFALTAYDYFDKSHRLGLYSGHWAGCGNFRDIKHDDGMFQQNLLALSIHDAPYAKFIISGELRISKKTFLKYLQNAKKIQIELIPLQVNPNFYFPFPEYIEVEDFEKGRIDNAPIVLLKLKEKELHVSVNAESYPFEKYRIGFSTEVTVWESDSQQPHPLAMDVAIVNTNLSNPLIVRQIEKVEEFLSNSEMLGATRFNTSQCALIVERAVWYQAMVVFLIGLIFTPAVLLLYKADADPSLELIAALLGVATIRSYLLGAPADWNIYPIDVVFAGAVLLTAVIPLWRLSKRKTQ